MPGTRILCIRQRLRPLLLALLCPLMAHADGDVGVKAEVREGSTVKEAAMFQVSKNPTFKVVDGKLVMTVGDNDANVAELPLKNGAEMHVTVAAYDESQNKKAVAVSSAGYSTLYSAFQVTVPSGVEVYAPAYDAERNVLKMNSETLVAEGTVLPAGTGVVLKNQGIYDFAYSDAEPTAVTSALTGSVVAAPVTDYDGTIYSLAKEDNVVAFYRYTPSATVGGKAFLVLNKSLQTKRVTFAFDEITNIDNNERGQNVVDGPIYNLSGQKVGGSYRGIVIQNGQKIRRK